MQSFTVTLSTPEEATAYGEFLEQNLACDSTVTVDGCTVTVEA